MAEGGPSLPREKILEYPKWDWLTGSLEYVFASDFIHFVIARQDRSWRSFQQLNHFCPITPFNTTIQDVVEKVLGRESVYMENMFRQITEPYDKLTVARFNLCAILIKDVYFGDLIQSPGGLLKYFCIVGQFSLWALKQGLYMAPFCGLDIILGYMKEFGEQKKLPSLDYLWMRLEREAEGALTLRDVTLIQDSTLERLRKLQRKAEEETPTEEEDPTRTAGGKCCSESETSEKGDPPLEQSDGTIEVKQPVSEGASKLPPETPKPDYSKDLASPSSEQPGDVKGSATPGDQPGDVKGSTTPGEQPGDVKGSATPGEQPGDAKGSTPGTQSGNTKDLASPSSERSVGKGVLPKISRGKSVGEGVLPSPLRRKSSGPKDSPPPLSRKSSDPKKLSSPSGKKLPPTSKEAGKTNQTKDKETPKARWQI